MILQKYKVIVILYDLYLVFIILGYFLQIIDIIPKILKSPRYSPYIFQTQYCGSIILGRKVK